MADRRPTTLTRFSRSVPPCCATANCRHATGAGLALSEALHLDGNALAGVTNEAISPLAAMQAAVAAMAMMRARPAYGAIKYAGRSALAIVFRADRADLRGDSALKLLSHMIFATNHGDDASEPWRNCFSTRWSWTIWPSGRRVATAWMLPFHAAAVDRRRTLVAAAVGTGFAAAGACRKADALP